MKPFPIATLGIFAAIAVGFGLLMLQNEGATSGRNGVLEPQAPAPNNGRIDPEKGMTAWTDLVLDPEIDTQELLALVRRLVVLDAPAALEWAHSQADLTLRQRAMAAVFESWAERDAWAAVEAALRENEDNRFLCMEAALKGAAKNPDLAVELVRRLLATDSNHGHSCATMLIGSLSRAGEFQSALGLLDDLPGETRNNDVRSIFDLWGQTQPEEAAKALESISDISVRAAAFSAMMEGWSRNDPGALADYALKLPSGDERLRALETAIERWTLIDPAAMGTWLNQCADEPIRDFGAATMLLQSDQLNRSLKTAIAWAETIRDPELRLVALAHVTREWAHQNQSEAEQYLRATHKLNDTQRAWLMENLVDRTAALRDF